MPARGEVVQALAGFEFHVLDADPRRIKRVRIVRRRTLVRRRPAKPENETGIASPRPPDAGGGMTQRRVLTGAAGLLSRSGLTRRADRCILPPDIFGFF